MIPTTIRTTPAAEIVIPAYNAEQTIARALRSLQRQTVANWRALVVDDGSTDGTATSIRSFCDRDARIVLLPQTNAGTAAARNRALAEAMGDFVVFLDADDALLPTYLETQLAAAASRPRFDVIACNGLVPGRFGSVRPLHSGAAAQPREIDVAELMLSNTLPYFALVRRVALEDVAGFEPSSYCEDYDLWARLVMKGHRIYYTGAPLALYSPAKGSKSARYQPVARDSARIRRTLSAHYYSGGGDRALAAEANDRAALMVQRADFVARLGSAPSRSLLKEHLRLRKAYSGFGHWLAQGLLLVSSPRLAAAVNNVSGEQPRQ